MPGLSLVRNRVPLGRELWKAGGARACSHRTRLQTSAVLTHGKESCVSPAAAVSRTHRDGRKASSDLPALRLAGRRTGHGNSETPRTGGTRLVAAPSRSPFLFRSTGQNVSRSRHTPGTRRLLRWLRSQCDVHRFERSHDPRPHREWL